MLVTFLVGRWQLHIIECMHVHMHEWMRHTQITCDERIYCCRLDGIRIRRFVVQQRGRVQWIPLSTFECEFWQMLCVSGSLLPTARWSHCLFWSAELIHWVGLYPRRFHPGKRWWGLPRSCSHSLSLFLCWIVHLRRSLGPPTSAWRKRGIGRTSHFANLAGGGCGSRCSKSPPRARSHQCRLKISRSSRSLCYPKGWGKRAGTYCEGRRVHSRLEMTIDLLVVEKINHHHLMTQLKWWMRLLPSQEQVEWTLYEIGVWKWLGEWKASKHLGLYWEEPWLFLIKARKK